MIEKYTLTYKDLEDIFKTTKVRTKMKEWEKFNFPAPLPYSTRPKRWNSKAVLAWKERYETSKGANGFNYEGNISKLQNSIPKQ